MTAALFICLFASGAAQAQTLYHTTPDWTSNDKKYSTGGAFVDLDRDGWLDLVVANGNDMAREYVVVYYNKGDGTFPLLPDWKAQDQTYNGHLDVADVNGDGWQDVAVVHLLESTGGDSAAKLYLNNNGTLSSLPDWSSTEKARSFGCAFGDVNNDGRPDLAVATGWAYSPAKYYKNYVYLNVNGQLEQTASWKSDDTSTDQGVLWVDANRDGWLDLVATGAKKATRIYPNLGGVLDTRPSWQSTDNNSQDAIMMTCGDVDGDGYEDLFVTDNNQLSGGSGQFRQYNGLAAGYFTTDPTWTYFDGYGSAIALADVDADNDLDLATGAWWDRTRLFFNDGTGFGASPNWNSAGTSVVEKIIFGDVNPTDDSVKIAVNVFPPDGGRKLFHLSRRHIQGVSSVKLDGQVLDPSQYVASREHGWITVHQAPAVALEVEFTYSISVDMAITNWDSSKGNYLYYNQREPDWLSGSADTLSAATGGTIDLDLAARQENGGRNYLVLASVTGTAPGYLLPGGVETLPLVWDPFTDVVMILLNTSIFSSFLGSLDADGNAAAQINAPALDPVHIGVTMYYAFCLNGPFNFASNPVTVEVVP
jgi:hypothetical protein